MVGTESGQIGKTGGNEDKKERILKGNRKKEREGRDGGSKERLKKQMKEEK